MDYVVFWPIDLPVKGNQIPNYEKLNNSSLYVIGYDEKDQFFQCTLFQFK